MKKTTLGHVALGFPLEGGQPERQCCVWPASSALSARWRFGLGTARHGTRLALDLAG